MLQTLTGHLLLLSSGLGQLGMLRSLAFKDCSWLGDQGANRPPWCPSLTGLTSLTELVFDNCPMLNTLPDAVSSLSRGIMRRVSCNSDCAVQGPGDCFPAAILFYKYQPALSNCMAAMP